jgi:hypothetical protein
MGPVYRYQAVEGQDSTSDSSGFLTVKDGTDKLPGKAIKITNVCCVTAQKSEDLQSDER